MKRTSPRRPLRSPFTVCEGMTVYSFIRLLDCLSCVTVEGAVDLADFRDVCNSKIGT